jgi:hypothetical protein
MSNAEDRAYERGYRQGANDTAKAIHGDMRDWSNVRYLLDGNGELWKGPLSPESTLHWARFYGICYDGSPIWCLERSACPERWMTTEQVERAICKIAERERIKEEKRKKVLGRNFVHQKAREE